MSELWIEDWKRSDGMIELGVRFEGRHKMTRLWYRVEDQHEPELTRHADPLVLGSLMIAMHEGNELRVHGTASPSLLRNLEEFQRAWAAWKPDYYKVIEVRADHEVEPSYPSRNEAICCFSGGVDSCFTAYRQARGIGVSFPFTLKTAVLVHGFDIPLLETGYFESAAAKVTSQLNSIGIGLYRVATNFKEISIFWPHANATGVASVLSLFQRRYHTGLVGQTVPYDSYRNLVEGSNPLTDPMLSSDSFRIVPDGAGFQRWEKIRLISDWTEGMEHLRVCWEGEKKDANCCDCEKCIRNILTFRALGLQVPASFPVTPSDERIYQLGPLKEFTIGIGYDSLLALARESGREKEGWVIAIKKAIHRSRMIRKLILSRCGRLRLWLLRRFFPEWRQPPDRIKF